MPISHTRTHMHCNTRRETLTQTQQTYRIFHCAYVFEGWWAVAMLCAILVCVSVYPLARTEPIFKRLETPPSLSSFHEQLNRHNELRAYWKSPQSAMSRPTEFSTTKKHVKAALQRAQILLFSEWAQREREREKVVPQQRGKMVEKPTESRENSGTFSTRKTLSVTLPNHMFCIPSKTLRLQIPSPPQPQLELPGFLRFVYS